MPPPVQAGCEHALHLVMGRHVKDACSLQGRYPHRASGWLASPVSPAPRMPWENLTVAVSDLRNFCINKAVHILPASPPCHTCAPRTMLLWCHCHGSPTSRLSVIAASDNCWKTQLPARMWWEMTLRFHGADTFCF